MCSSRYFCRSWRVTLPLARPPFKRIKTAASALNVSWKVQTRWGTCFYRAAVLVLADWVEVKLSRSESDLCTSWSVDALFAPGMNRNTQYAWSSCLLELNPQFSLDRLLVQSRRRTFSHFSNHFAATLPKFHHELQRPNSSTRYRTFYHFKRFLSFSSSQLIKFRMF